MLMFKIREETNSTAVSRKRHRKCCSMFKGRTSMDTSLQVRPKQDSFFFFKLFKILVKTTPSPPPHL